MADQFNADDYLNDGGTGGTAQAVKEVKRTMSQEQKEVTKKLANNKLSEAEITRIVNANHETVSNMSKEMKLSLRDLVKDLTQFENDELKTVLAEFSTLNAEEQAIADAPVNREVTLKAELKRLEATPNNIWNRWFKGRTKKIAATKEELALMPKRIQDAIDTAESMREKRFDQAKVDALLNVISEKTAAIIKVMQEKKLDAKEAFLETQKRLKKAQEVYKKATVSLEDIKGKVEENESLLRQEENTLLNLTPATADYVDQQATISNLKQVLDDLKARRKSAQTIFDSKENFIKKHEITLETLNSQISNIHAIQGKLSSDNKERDSMYKSYVESVILASAEEFANIMEEFGEQTDTMVVDHMMAIKHATDNNFTAMLKKHQGRQDRYHSSLVLLAERSAKFDLDIANLDKMRSEGYGLDQQDLFVKNKTVIRKSNPSDDASSPKGNDDSGSIDDEENYL